jgi:hypothetical protein
VWVCVRVCVRGCARVCDGGGGAGGCVHLLIKIQERTRSVGECGFTMQRLLFVYRLYTHILRRL